MKRILGIVILMMLLPAPFFAGCSIQSKPYQETQFGMDTVVEITAYGPHAEKAVKAAFAEMRRLDALLNSYHPDSEIAMINGNAGGRPVAVSEDTFKVIAKAVHFAQITGGAFDPTIGPVVNLWSIGKKGDFVPDKDQLEGALRLVDYRRLEIDAAGRTARLSAQGMSIDLGGIAKSYIISQMADTLIKNGITSALINGGGDIKAIGKKPGGSPWKIGVQHPRQTDKLAVKLWLSRWDRVTTSGDYQRYFDKDGVRYHHIFDPKTGYPASTMPSATLIFENTAEDIPSNIVMVLGKDRALDFLRQYPGVEAVFTNSDGTVSYTPGLNGSIETGG